MESHQYITICCSTDFSVEVAELGLQGFTISHIVPAMESCGEPPRIIMVKSSVILPA